MSSNAISDVGVLLLKLPNHAPKHLRHHSGRIVRRRLQPVKVSNHNHDREHTH